MCLTSGPDLHLVLLSGLLACRHTRRGGGPRPAAQPRWSPTSCDPPPVAAPRSCTFGMRVWSLGLGVWGFWSGD